VPHPHRRDLTNPPRLNQLASALVVRARSLLRARLDDAVVPAGDLNHPAPFAREKREWFLDVNILSRGTRHHGHQGVPVVWRGYDHRIDVALIEKGSKVGERAGRAAGQADALVTTTAVNLRDGHNSGIRLILEVEKVPLSDQTESDQADPNPIVRAQDTAVRRGAHGSRGTTLKQASPAQ
jgi:hypothetical protein